MARQSIIKVIRLVHDISRQNCMCCLLTSCSKNVDINKLLSNFTQCRSHFSAIHPASCSLRGEPWPWGPVPQYWRQAGSWHMGSRSKRRRHQYSTRKIPPWCCTCPCGSGISTSQSKIFLVNSKLCEVKFTEISFELNETRSNSPYNAN